MRNTISETVTKVHHWNDTLFSFNTTRGNSFTFENGQFVMIGLEVDGRPLLRAYSIASANYEEELEFFSIKVPDGALTSRLQKIKPGDELILSTRATGTLVPGYLKPGKRLYLLSSGTGLAPFMSIIKDPFIYDAYEHVVLVHSVRYVSELAYKNEIENVLPKNEYFGEEVKKKLIYYPTVTRENFQYQSVDEQDNRSSHHERITTLLTTNRLTDDIGLPEIDPEFDRFMICGNNDMLQDLMNILDDHGFTKANSRSLGEYVIEQAFIEK
ncbi:ferredoxin--NADP reductase [Glaciecola siphonariae]|uniref:ferredoxin--NADP(+) reductase n=1 Tax=Glaciecola siphonariae TaxID=521012 RepID=A0ABV9LU66_9ALTE